MDMENGDIPKEYQDDNSEGQRKSENFYENNSLKMN